MNAELLLSFLKVVHAWGVAMSRKYDLRIPLEAGLNRSLERPMPALGVFEAIVRSSAKQRRADEIGDAAKQYHLLHLGEHPLAQIYRVEISNFRHNRVSPLQHNAPQLYSSPSSAVVKQLSSTTGNFK